MRVHFYWPECRLDMVQMAWSRSERTVFWVSVGREELSQITDHMESEGIAKLTEALSDELFAEDNYWLDGRLYFFVPAWVTKDDPPVLGLRVYPHSGMWNGRRPWLSIGPPRPDHGFNEPEGLEVGTIAELDKLRYTIANRYHLVAS